MNLIKPLYTLSIKDIAIGSQLNIIGIRGSDILYATNISKQHGRPISLVSGNVTAVKLGQIELDNILTFNVLRGALSDIKIGDFVNIDKIHSKTKNKTGKLSLKRIYGPIFDGSVDRTSVEGFFSLQNATTSPKNLMRKSHVKRQIIFKVNSSDNKSIVIGAVQLDKERSKKLDFDRQPKVIQNHTNSNKSEEIDLSPKKKK